MLNFSCMSLHAFYFYVKQFCVLITVNQWRCQRWNGHVPINLSSFDTRISLVNIVTQKMYSFEAVSCRTKLPYNVKCSQKLMSKLLKLVKVSIHSQANNTRGEGFYFYRPKTWCRILASIRILLMAEYSNTLFSNESQPYMSLFFWTTWLHYNCLFVW